MSRPPGSGFTPINQDNYNGASKLQQQQQQQSGSGFPAVRPNPNAPMQNNQAQMDYQTQSSYLRVSIEDPSINLEYSMPGYNGSSPQSSPGDAIPHNMNMTPQQSISPMNNMLFPQHTGGSALSHQSSLASVHNKGSDYRSILPATSNDVNPTQDQNFRIPEKRFFTKKPHKKSRTGCDMCKTRKVKCDEAKPTCCACLQRGFKCQYLAPRKITRERRPRPINEDSWVDSKYSTSSEVAPRKGGMPVTSHVDVIDMQLMWYYMGATWRTFTTKAGDKLTDHVLTMKIPKIAFEQPFMMDAILGIASSHIVLMNVSTTMTYERALLYRRRAVMSYQQAMAHASVEIYPALAAAGLMVIVMSCQAFGDPKSPPLFILKWMSLFHNLSRIIYRSPPRNFAKSGFNVLFARPEIDLVGARSHIPLYLKNALADMRNEDSTRSNDREWQVCDRTLSYIGALHAEFVNGPTAYLHLLVFTWATYLPREFMPLAVRQRPMALLIVAHYCIFTKLLSKAWWMSGVGDRQIREIYDVIPARYQDHFNFPVAVVDIQDRLECIRYIKAEQSWTPPTSLEEMEKLRGRVLGVSYVDDQGRPVDLDKATSWQTVPAAPSRQGPDVDDNISEYSENNHIDSSCESADMNPLRMSRESFSHLMPPSPVAIFNNNDPQGPPSIPVSSTPESGFDVHLFSQSSPNSGTQIQNSSRSPAHATPSNTVNLPTRPAPVRNMTMEHQRPLPSEPLQGFGKSDINQQSLSMQSVASSSSSLSGCFQPLSEQSVYIKHKSQSPNTNGPSVPQIGRNMTPPMSQPSNPYSPQISPHSVHNMPPQQFHQPPIAPRLPSLDYDFDMSDLSVTQADPAMAFHSFQPPPSMSMVPNIDAIAAAVSEASMMNSPEIRAVLAQMDADVDVDFEMVLPQTTPRKQNRGNGN